MSILYIVRDRQSQGVDFILWGRDDFAAACVSLQDALAVGLDVELAAIPEGAVDELLADLLGLDPPAPVPGSDEWKEFVADAAAVPPARRTAAQRLELERAVALWESEKVSRKH